jgi:ABC-type Na+ efflux pump permease subunit
MMVIAAMLTSLTVAREWETGTMEQVISTPLKGPELILGKLLPYFSIGMLDVLVAVLMGEFLFEVPLRGNVALLFGMAAVFLIRRALTRHVDQHRDQSPVAGQPTRHGGHVPAGLPALRVHV